MDVKCDSCGGKEVKYRCPSCSRRTCSLQCVKDHKKTYQCSGIRCKTKYVSMTDYNRNNLLSDYRFLEDTERVAYIAGSNKARRNLNRTTSTLLKKARKSGVILKLMPIGMSKRMENTSYFNQRVPENTKLNDLLKDYIDPESSDPVNRQRLKVYTRVPQNQLSIFLKKEYQPANQERYHPIDANKTLMENLQGKTIIEFPTFYIVLSEKANQYTIDVDTIETPSNNDTVDTALNNDSTIKKH